MEERIQKELVLLRKYYPALTYYPESRWVLIPAYPLSDGWSSSVTDVVFHIPPAYPGTPPYGICVPVGLSYQGNQPQNYNPLNQSVPFEGNWGIFSWQPAEGQWRPTADLLSGSNLLNWVRGFAERFKEGV